MNILKIALSLLARASRSVIADAFGQFDRTLNEKLYDMAASKGIELNHQVNLVAGAVDAAYTAGGGKSSMTFEDAHMIAMEAINRVVSRQSETGGFKQLSKDYARNTVLVHIVLDLKSKGKTFDEIKNDPRVDEICNHFGIRPSTLERYYKGEVKPNRAIDNLETMGIKDSASNIFDEFKAHGGHTFESYWYSAIRNECRMIARELRADKNKAITDALRIMPEDRNPSELNQPIPGTISESALSTENTDLLEVKQLATKLKDDLKKINPQYVEALKMMNDDKLDITNSAHYKYFMKAFGMLDKAAFLRFQKAFLLDLKRVFQKLEVSGPEEATHVMRYAKAEKVLAAAEAIYGKLLLRSSR